MIGFLFSPGRDKSFWQIYRGLLIIRYLRDGVWAVKGYGLRFKWVGLGILTPAHFGAYLTSLLRQREKFD